MWWVVLVGCGVEAPPCAEGRTEVFEDRDGDGFGGTSLGLACDPPPATALVGGDCDDGAPEVHPRAAEVCDGVDQDCDGTADEGLPTSAWVPDADGDGYGSADAPPQRRCAAFAGFVRSASDCDDGDAAINPASTERCGGQDDDCDGLVDDVDPDVADPVWWYRDDDGDGFGRDDVTSLACEREGAARVGGDCDDARPAVYPGAVELCDGVDDDCDGVADDGLLSTWYVDEDDDGYGVEPVLACADTDRLAPVGGDCHDHSPRHHPAAVEWCGEDCDCDGLVGLDDPDVSDAFHVYADADGDGFGDPALPALTCEVLVGAVDDATDCDDSEPEVGGAREWWTDADGDGDGAEPRLGSSCVPPTTDAVVVGRLADCDDADPTIGPHARELALDGVDQDCTGADASADSALYALSAGSLHRLDPAALTAEDVGPLGLPPGSLPMGLAVDPATGDAWTLSWGRALYAVDLGTGAATWVADLAETEGHSLTFCPDDGLLYTIDLTFGVHLVALDPTTGAERSRRVFLDAPLLVDLAWDAPRRRFVADDYGGQLFALDPAGSVEPLGSSPAALADPRALAVDPLADRYLQSSAWLGPDPGTFLDVLDPVAGTASRGAVVPSSELPSVGVFGLVWVERAP